MSARRVNKMTLYLNTMVFTVMAGVVSLMLLLLLMTGSELATEYAALIITLELGLVAVIIAAILRIYWYERRLSRASKNGLENQLAVKSCPDYWTMKEARDGSTSCVNTYTTPVAAGAGAMAPVTTFKTQATKDVVQLSDYNNKPIRTLCPMVKELNAPWTEVRAVCDSYRVPT